MKKGNYVLWLPSWYPSKVAPLNGDFIQRHARAVALYQDVQVIYVVRDKDGTVTKNVLVEQNRQGRLTETIIYYHVQAGISKKIGQLKSFWLYRKLFKKAFLSLAASRGLPKFSHVHVALKAGYHALWLRRRFAVPFLVSEQWVIYLKEACPGIVQQPFYFKTTFRRVFQQASGVSVVSGVLGKSIQEHFSIPGFIIIPNVVDTSIFFPVHKPEGNAITFMHVSTLDYQKNPEAMIQAFKLFKSTYGKPFLLHIVGPDHPDLKLLVEQLELTSEIQFHSEVPQTELAKLMRSSDALILFSRYETFGCVLIEANACGLPVIVSDIPVFHENVRHMENGLFAKPGDPQSLADALIQFVNEKKCFEPAIIAEKAALAYNFEKIGKQFVNWYLHTFSQEQ